MWFGLPDHIEILVLEYDSTYQRIIQQKFIFE